MTQLEIVIGTGNRHKAAEIAAILAGVPGLSVRPFTDFEPVPEVDEDGATFAENAGKKALLLAGYLNARRAHADSGRHTAVGGDTATIERVSLERAREQAEEALGIVRQGASGSRRNLGAARIKPGDVLVLADDSGLAVDALGGAPGVHSARYAGEHGADRANNDKLLAALAEVPTERRTARFVCCLALATQRELLFTVEGKVEGRIAERPAGESGFGYDPLFYYPPYGTTFGQVSAEAKNAVSHRADALKRFKGRLMRLLSDEGLA